MVTKFTVGGFKEDIWRSGIKVISLEWRVNEGEMRMPP
jgi:hypothetical protein